MHKAERVLAAFYEVHYPNRLQQAFAEAERVLVVNPQIAALVDRYAPTVHVIPSGFDPLRFPVEYQVPPDPGLFDGIRRHDNCEPSRNSGIRSEF